MGVAASGSPSPMMADSPSVCYPPFNIALGGHAVVVMTGKMTSVSFVVVTVAVHLKSAVGRAD